MKPNPATPAAYLASLPADRREALSVVRASILKHLPKGYVESTGWGMITYSIPLSVFANTYNKLPLAIAALGAQKGYMVVHLMALYGDPKLLAWFVDEFKRTGKKLDMGKACIRFKTLDDLPVDLIGRTVAKVPADQLIAWHEKVHAPRREARKSRAKAGKPAPRAPLAPSTPVAKTPSRSASKPRK
jgi:hypothetical protein